MRRSRQAMNAEECAAVFKRGTSGVLALSGDDGYPYAMPMNHFYNPDDRCLYFHCGKAGHRLDALKCSQKVSFCVCEQGHREAGDWAYHVRSVIVFGKMEIIDDIDKIIPITTALCHKFTNDESYIKNEIEHHAKATLLLKLTPEHICGKKVIES